MIKSIGLLGINKYGFEILKKIFFKKEIEIKFVTNKSKSSPHTRKIDNELAKFCDDNKLNYLGKSDINSKSLINLMKSVDLAIIGGYDKILKKEAIESPKFGVINTHFGMIPENRGCNPTMWAILKKMDQGFTTYFVNESIDYGEIINRKKVLPYSINTTSLSAYDLITEEAVNDFENILFKIENNKTLGFPDNKGNYFGQGLPNKGFINLDWQDEKIVRYSNALWFPPYKPAKVRKNGKIYFMKADFDKNGSLSIKYYD